MYPPFLARLLACLTACHDRGQDYYATSGYRSAEEQAALYQAHLAGGPRASPPWSSAHQFGCAVDLAPDSDPALPGLQGPAYDRAHYAILADEAPKHGLVWGGTFGDDPHVQIPRFVSGKSLQTLRAVVEHLPEPDRAATLWAWLDALPLFPPS